LYIENLLKATCQYVFLDIAVSQFYCGNKKNPKTAVSQRRLWNKGGQKSRCLGREAIYYLAHFLVKVVYQKTIKNNPQQTQPEEEKAARGPNKCL